MKSGKAIPILATLATLWGIASFAQQPSNWTDMMSGMHRMHAAMASVKASGDSDLDFVQLMLPHHQAALDMAKAELLHGSDPQMRRLAQEIIADQQSEIELMRLWRKQRQARPQHP
jgi:uncharacterized protein (DUF305 family)